jgi:uncharacterized membrane protein YhhN
VTHRATAVFVALAVVDTLLAATGCDRLRWLTKPALMPVLMRGRDRSVQRALALGGAGDVALLGGTEVTFRAGLACFLAGHVAWIMALRERPGGGLLRAKPALAAPHLAAFGVMNAYLWKRTGKDRIPVIVYSTALLAMALAALDSGSPRTAAGGALFLASDALIALEKFGGLHLPAHEGVVSWTAANMIILAKHDPTAPTSQRQPGRIIGLLSCSLTIDLSQRPGDQPNLTERSREGYLAQAAVDQELRRRGVASPTG